MDIIFLPGLLCDDTVWRPIADRLNARYPSVRIMSITGLGSIGELADRVLQAVSGTAIIVGHSLGARVAIEAWRRAPTRVVGLGLISMGTNPLMEGEVENRRLVVDVALNEGVTAIAPHWAKVVLSADSQRDSALVDDLIAMACRMSAADYALQIEAFLGRAPLDDVLPSISVPTLLLASVEDRLAGTEQMRWAQSLIPGAVGVHLLQGGHMLPLEKTDLVASELEKWVASIARD